MKLEVGMYVRTKNGNIRKIVEVYTTWLKEYKQDEIYSIVTKEQFSQMEYKVVE